MALHQFDLIRDILDKQLVDKDEKQMGRIDGVVIELRDGQPPRVDHFELGFTVLAKRVYPRAAAWTRRGARQHVPWDEVHEVTQHHVKLDVDAEKTPAFDWERWLRKHIVSKLPGGKEKDE
ncbi:MAG: hypothetical protein DMF56_05300 [Acidobacteria bacterium]|nr:MAG: hypothetical protein DMF56_05300 [Acidobacteriota bacterium]